MELKTRLFMLIFCLKAAKMSSFLSITLLIYRSFLASFNPVGTQSLDFISENNFAVSKIMPIFIASN